MEHVYLFAGDITLMKSNSDIQQLYSTAKVIVNNLFQWFVQTNFNANKTKIK